MARPKPWHVRVIRRIEDTVLVYVHDEAEAYVEAAKMPGVLSVMLKSAIPADKVAGAEPPPGIAEE